LISFKKIPLDSKLSSSGCVIYNVPTRTTAVCKQCCSSCFHENRQFTSRYVEQFNTIPNKSILKNNNNLKQIETSNNNNTEVDTDSSSSVFKKIKNNKRLFIGILIVCILLIIGSIGLIVGLAFGLGEL